MEGIGADNFIPVGAGVVVKILLVEQVGAIPIQRQLLATLNDILVVAVQTIFGIAHALDVPVHAAYQ